jgi:potassium uptake TrkH family protein
VPLAFLIAIAVGTVLLMTPLARIGPEGAPPLTALFTAVSAVCVTGLIVEDTPNYWSQFGQVVILLLFQIGGFGIMTAATLLTMMVNRKFRLRSRLVAQAETKSSSLGEVGGVLRLVFIVTFVVEAIVALVLIWRFRLGYDHGWGEAVWHGVFQSVSAFNNAGFSTFSDSLMGFAQDPLVLAPLMVAVVIGGLGFPVLYELRKAPRAPSRWSIHTKLTVLGSIGLFLVGFIAVATYEWSNPRTLGALDWPWRLLNAATQSVMTRTAGFNSLDVGAFQTETLSVSYVLMLIGGGSAGTAGGIKVTTFFLLGFVVWAEIRGREDAVAFGRRISTGAQRQALSVVLLAASAVGAGILILLSATELPLEDVVFEVISAFATVGLSTGVTADLPPVALITLCLLMFIGRVGTITVATALALNERTIPYRYPEERPIVG